jgi:hypothetical protein
MALSSAPADDATKWPVTISVWAVQALKTGSTEKHYESGAQAVRKAVDDLPFDTFRGVFSGGVTMPPGKEARLMLNDAYSLLLQCPAREGKDAIHLDVTVELAPTGPGEPPRKAVQSCMIVYAGKMVRIGGLKMNEGEMVVVLEMTR